MLPLSLGVVKGRMSIRLKWSKFCGGSPAAQQLSLGGQVFSKVSRGRQDEIEGRFVVQHGTASGSHTCPLLTASLSGAGMECVLQQDALIACFKLYSL